MAIFLFLLPQEDRIPCCLNFTGTNVPLRVINNCTIGTNSSIKSLYSGLQIGGDLTLDGSFVQEGGITIATNGIVTLGGAMTLTNANVFFSSLDALGGSVIQSGGSLSTSNLDDGKYTLYDGVLSAQSAFLNGFTQYGGEFGSQFIRVFGAISSLNGGTIVCTNMSVYADDFLQVRREAGCGNGNLSVTGIFRGLRSVVFWVLQLGGWLQLRCQYLWVNELGDVFQRGGTNCVSGNLSCERRGIQS